MIVINLVLFIGLVLLARDLQSLVGMVFTTSVYTVSLSRRGENKILIKNHCITIRHFYSGSLEDIVLIVQLSAALPCQILTVR